MRKTLHSSKISHIAKGLIFFQLLQIVSIPFAAANSQANVNEATATLSNYAESQLNTKTEVWLNQYGTSRVKTHYDLDAGKFDDSSIDMLFSLYDNKDDLFFTQFGYRNYDDRNTINLGFGYRVHNDESLFGLNSFYDRDLTGSNDRISVGAEYFRDYLRFNANGYLGISNWQDSDETWFENNQVIALEEKAADGFDVALTGYIPNYPQIGLKLGYEQYFGDNVNLFGENNLSSDPYAVTFGLNHTPVPLFTWGIEHKQGDGSNHDTRLNVGITYRFGETWDNQTNPDNVDSLRSFKGGRLDLVERNNIITLDYRRKAQPTAPSTPEVQVADRIELKIITDNAFANGIAENLVGAVVLDENGLPMPGVVVQFTTPEGSVPVTTNEFGIAYLPIHSSVVGKMPITVTVVDNDTLTSSVDINFIDEAILDGSQLSMLVIENDALANNTEENIVEAKLVDASGKALAGIEIEFVDDSGKVVGKGTTDTSGKVTAPLISTTAGLTDITAKVANSSKPIESAKTPVNFIKVPTPNDVSEIVVSTTIDGALANGTTPNQVTAEVLDVNGKPLKGLTVDFFDPSGKVVGTGITDSQGIAKANITSVTPGMIEITAKVTGNNTITGQTDVRFTDKAGLVDSKLTLTPKINNSVADGKTPNTVEANIVDFEGKPLEGILIDFVDDKGNVITQGKTDAEGNVIGNITSSTPGDINVTARVSGSNPPIVSSPPVTVTFVEVPVATTIEVFKPESPAIADGTDTNTVSAVIKDQNGVIMPGVEVEFVDSDGNVLAEDITDDNGYVSTDLTSKVAGTTPVTARVKVNTDIKGTVYAVFVANPATAKIVSIAPKNPDLVLVANDTDTTEIEIVITDAEGNILIDFPLKSITDNKGYTYPGTYTTDKDGKIVIKTPVTKIPGSVEITADLKNGTDPGRVTIDYEQFLDGAVITAKPEKEVIIANNKDTTQITGQLINQLKQPIANQKIQILIEGIADPVFTTTDADGNYSIPLPPSDKLGNVGITVSTLDLPTNVTASTSVIFNGDVSSKQLIFDAKKDILTANMNTKGNTSDLIVTVKDASNIPIMNQEVTIFDPESQKNYTGVTNDQGIFIYSYQPYDSSRRLEAGITVEFEADFVTDPKGVVKDSIYLAYGNVSVSLPDSSIGSITIGEEVRLKIEATNPYNNINFDGGFFEISSNLADFGITNGLEIISREPLIKSGNNNGIDTYAGYVTIKIIPSPEISGIANEILSIKVIDWTTNPDRSRILIIGGSKDIQITE